MSRRIPIKNEDLSGRTFGRLTVIKEVTKPIDTKKMGRYWICECDCGETKIVNTSDLNYGTVSSCGCLISNRKRSAYHKNTYIEKESHVEVFDEIGGAFCVDLETYHVLKNLNRYWYVRVVKHKNGRIEKYVVSKIDSKCVSLHTYIMNPEYGYIVDHIDGDGTNNKIENLRVVSIFQNNMNKGTAKNNTSGYKGVCWNKEKQKWQSRIQIDKKQLFLGCFDDIQEAVEARKDAEIKYYGEYSRQYGSICDKTIEDINID